MLYSNGIHLLAGLLILVTQPSGCISTARRFDRIQQTSYVVQHIEYISSNSFEQVVADFESSLGSVENGSLKLLVAKAKNLTEFETGVHQLEGESGFLLFLTINHGAYLPFYGISGKKLKMYTIGNPLIAETMLQYDIRAGLNVPVRLLIYESSVDQTTRITYDVPSSLMSELRNADVRRAAQKLDVKLEALCKCAAAFRKK